MAHSEGVLPEVFVPAVCLVQGEEDKKKNHTVSRQKVTYGLALVALHFCVQPELGAAHPRSVSLYRSLKCLAQPF